jgi:Zn-dependent peptidase ImmA (M78 family)
MRVVETRQVNPKMVKLAREARSLRQTELAAKVGLQSGKICKVELEIQTFSEDTLSRMSQVLGFPQGFFFQEGDIYPPNLNYRKRVDIRQKFMDCIEAGINIYRLNIQHLLRANEKYTHAVPTFEVSEKQTPEVIADKVRRKWDIPNGRIENLTELVEKTGIIIVPTSFGTDKIDGRSILTENGHPVILLNDTLTGDRWRFTLAHELGHLVMHVFGKSSFERDVEREANRFASALLMPEKDIRPDLETDIDLSVLGKLKPKWKVSMQAILYRARNLGTVTENQYAYVARQFNNLKIKKREPEELDIPLEKPKLLAEMLAKTKKKLKFGNKELAAMLFLTEEELKVKYAFIS